MKSTMKIFLVVMLFSSVVFADEGNMGNGTRTCPNGQTTCFVSDPTTVDEETDSTKATDSTGSTGSVFNFVEEYFDSMIEYFQN